MVRIKNRWLLVQVRFEEGGNAELTASKVNEVGQNKEGGGNTPIQLLLLRAIRESIQICFGDLGSGALGGSIAIRYYSPITQNAIIRCSRLGVKHVWSAITMCTTLQDGKRVRMIVKHTSGTIRKVQQATIRADQRQIERLCLQKKQLIKEHQHRVTSIIQTNQEENVMLDQLAKDAISQSKKDVEAIEQ